MSSEARKVYDEAIVIDGLNVSNWESDAVFERLRAGNITAINATVATWENFVQTMAHLAAWMRRFRERQDILQVKETADIHAAKKLGKTGIILSFQNASPIENELDRLGLFLALGVRVIQLTYHETNLLGSGCWERNDCGLSNFGVDAVREMNRLGIVIDLSHVGPKTTMDAIEMSEQPVAITHANARSFCDHPRNKEEEALKLLAEKGGVVGATSFANFLPKGFDSTVEDFVDAIDDMVERIGIDHVAIGTDSTHDQPLEFWHYIVSQQGTKFPSTFADGSVPYTELSFQPKGIDSPAEFPNLAEALANRGYRAEEITKLLGGNWMSLFERVWNVLNPVSRAIAVAVAAQPTCGTHRWSAVRARTRVGPRSSCIPLGPPLVGPAHDERPLAYHTGRQPSLAHWHGRVFEPAVGRMS